MGSTLIQRAVAKLILFERGAVPDDGSRKKFIQAPVAVVSVDGAQYLTTLGGPYGAGGEGVPYAGGSDVQDEDWFLGGVSSMFNLSGEVKIIGEHQLGDWKQDSIYGMNKIGLI